MRNILPAPLHYKNRTPGEVLRSTESSNLEIVANRSIRHSVEPYVDDISKEITQLVDAWVLLF